MDEETLIDLLVAAHVPYEQKEKIIQDMENGKIDAELVNEIMDILTIEEAFHQKEIKEAEELKQKIIEERDKEIKIAKPKMQKVLERHKENMENIVKTVEKEGKELIAHLEKEIEGAIKKGDLNKIDDIKKKLGL